MKADLTRDSFDPFKHYTRVLMQQGRVQLDADWNEQASIVLRYMRSLAADIIGQHGGPADNLGFAISQLTTGQDGKNPVPVQNDFLITAGHYYVDGILCEIDSPKIPITGFPDSTTGKPPSQVKVLYWPQNDLSFQKDRYVELRTDAASPAPLRARIADVDPQARTLTLVGDISAFNNVKSSVRLLATYLTQPDYPVPDIERLSASTGGGVNNYLVYLDLWERHITWIEDDSIREVALGSADTATRTKLVCQVKTAIGTHNGGTTPCDEFAAKDPARLDRYLGINNGLLAARARQNAAPADPCITSPQARYSGPENQLYRLEVHTGGQAWDGKERPAPGVATFKWSRENGAVVFPISGGGGTSVLTLDTLGRDDRFGLAEGDWVEVQDDISVLQNSQTPQPLLQVLSIDRTSMSVTLSGASDIGKDLTKHPLMRRWDQKPGDPADGGLRLSSDNAALIIEKTDDQWLDLEDGIQIQFQPPDPQQPRPVYNSGDYWLIPARTSIGDVQWPSEIVRDNQGNPVKDGEGNLVRQRIAVPPAGVKHHIARLAVVTVDSNGVNVLHPTCQKSYTTLTQVVAPQR